MLPLQRPFHCSPSVALGHLTIGPSWPLEVGKPRAGQERCSTVNMLPDSGFCAGTPNVQLERCDRAWLSV